MPIKSFWEIEKYIKKLEYMLASGDDQTDITDSLLILFRKVEPFAVTERDRTYLRGRFNGQQVSLQAKG